MKRNVTLILTLMALLLLASCTDKKVMRERLEYLSQCNRADTVFTEAWLPRVDSLVRYFDRHGNANERMMAHYLQGRVHHDIGEAPQALECYLHATEQADTTREDCDLYTLAAVYGQMADLFEMNCMAEEEIDALNNLRICAEKDGDIYTSIKAHELLVRPYYLLDDTLKILRTTIEASDLYKKNGFHQAAASVYPSMIYIYLMQGKYNEAHDKMMVFENESGLFDKDGNICKGREHYYYTKGVYYKGIGRVDSAEYYFRKLLACDYKADAYKGLLSVYREIGLVDSITRFSILYQSALEDEISEIQANEISRITSLYNYSRNKEIAENNELKAKRSKAMNYILITSGLIIAVISFGLFYNYRRKKIAEILQAASYRQKYEDTKKELSILHDTYETVIRDIEHLQSRIENSKKGKAIHGNEHQALIKMGKELGQLLDEKQKIVDDLNAKIQEYEHLFQNLKSKDKELILLNSDIVKAFKKMANPKFVQLFPSDTDWRRLYEITSQHLSFFYMTIKDDYSLSKQELQTCVLIRLNFRNPEIARLLNTTPQRITNIKTNINKKIFSKTDASSLKENLKRL